MLLGGPVLGMCVAIFYFIRGQFGYCGGHLLCLLGEPIFVFVWPSLILLWELLLVCVW